MKTKTFLWVVALFIFYFATIGFILPFMLSAASDVLVIGGFVVILIDLFVTYKVISYCVIKIKKFYEEK
jgi:hypothetical protein